MSAIAPPTPRRSRSDHVPTARPLSAPPAAAAPAPLPYANPPRRGGKVMFEVPFRSAMSHADLAVLHHVLDLSTHMYPKMRPDPNSPGVARLDHFSGLFLERGADEGHWMLEGRTWGKPEPRAVHEWHLLAAQAARQLDSAVELPEPMPDTHPTTPDRPLGQAANRRLARLRRRLVGLP
jgi:hypothetical protein